MLSLLVAAVLPCLAHLQSPTPVWDLDKAWRRVTATREEVCLNGLWQWQPADGVANSVPQSHWGWFKVPGPWPGITDYMQSDCQTVYPDPSWKDAKLGSLTAAWYQREFSVPAGWHGQISIATAYVNSAAICFVDGKPAGKISFPEGSVDITGLVKPGTKHTLAMQVLALPLKSVFESYTDTDFAHLQQGSVARRGLCGDVYLTEEPPGPRVQSVRAEPSVRNGSLSVTASLANVDSARKYRLVAEVYDHGQLVKKFAGDVSGPAAKISTEWKPERLWDLNTPENQLELHVSLLSDQGKLLDSSLPVRFGFRELWIDGKNFMLNGTRVFWSCLPFANNLISAGATSYDGVKESLRRLKQIGVNMVYGSNYDCNPGSFLSFEEMLRAADDSGVMVAMTMPHFSEFDWSKPDSDTTNGYARQAAFFAKVCANHPCVVAYTTSHNATGYNEDMDPDRLDGIYAPVGGWSQNNIKKALRAEAIIRQLDPTRLVYHHAGGNIGQMDTINFYLNMLPIQEMDDWFQHWSEKGAKPVVTIEYGVPFSWDWSMYRGYFNGQREFGSAAGQWEYTIAEWNAQYLGDKVFPLSEYEKTDVRWEANMFRDGKAWHRWDYPYPMGTFRGDLDDQQRVWAKYTQDNWRAMRTWGVSGTSPWEICGTVWRPKEGVKRGRVDLPTDWASSQKPGYSPDFLDPHLERRDLAFGVDDWVPTVAGDALMRNNQPLLGYIGGKPGDFTEKGHTFLAGQTVSKQLIVVNNSRRTVPVKCLWKLAGTPASGSFTKTVETGTISMWPISATIPSGLAPGSYKLTAEFDFGPGSIGAGPVPTDEFTIDVMASVAPVRMPSVALYDPVGDTANLLERLGVKTIPVKPGDDLSRFHTLIIGRRALSLTGAGLDLSSVRNGMNVLVFEQSSDVLEQRFGFRVQEYGLRNVFRRVPGDPALAGLDEESLRDWHGSATLMPPQRTLEMTDKFFGAPTTYVNGLLVTREWRAGCRGNVSSVMIEKPPIGDFTALIDGGYGLQYSPLLEYREGLGSIVFCQMDVTRRTEDEPAVHRLLANLLLRLSAHHPSASFSMSYVGEPAGRSYLESCGYKMADGVGSGLVVVGPGASPAAIPSGSKVVGVGLDGDAIAKFVPGVEVKWSEYMAGTLAQSAPGSPFAGIGPSDLFDRDPKTMPLISGGADVSCGGVLAEKGNAVMMQLAPWKFSVDKQNTKRMFRRTSVALNRLLHNLGASSDCPLLQRFAKAPAIEGHAMPTGLYLDTPNEMDDPYRFFRW